MSNPRESRGRGHLVQDLAKKGIRSRRVLDSIGQTPRERFVEEALAGKAYNDVSLPIGEAQTISQPWIVARMTELLEPDGSGGDVLEIGTGSGYQAAILSHLFSRVFTVERIAALSQRARRTLRELSIENVHFKIFDGTYGWGEFAPYRGILVTAASPSVPEPLLSQLADGGHLVVPVADPASSRQQILTRVTREGDRFIEEVHGGCRFVPLIGRYGYDK
ncbi:MAG: protein-L-isoaspartate(D-aspartate) O-methyltransferase [Acidobacteriota bacterium]|nr:protein-L-isoaspartate(D-aspartate) O-methyltransferase [Acidobacteriota bacterium]MDH3786391.1 protein-L-isoaspartate(D-aspartate) O-methyltransferase [Acidobacteriota bacterium]